MTRQCAFCRTRQCVFCHADFSPKRASQLYCCKLHATKDRVARHRKRYMGTRPKKPQELAKKERYIENTPVSYTEEPITGLSDAPVGPYVASYGQPRGVTCGQPKLTWVNWEGFHGVIRLHLNDEAPRIGCGERPLTVSVGPKRVRLVNHYTGDMASLHREVFERLAVRAIEQGRSDLRIALCSS